jgi:hypothetical protein
MSNRALVGILLGCLVLLQYATVLQVSTTSAELESADAFVPNEILVKFKPSARSLDRMAIRTSLSAETVHEYLSGVEHWRTPPNISVEESLSFLRQRSVSVL